MTTQPIEPASPQLPLLHFNGSGKHLLIEQLTGVHEAADQLLAALRQASPHPRDYYPLGDDAFQRAQREHLTRLQKATDILNEVAAIRLQLVVAGERGSTRQ